MRWRYFLTLHAAAERSSRSSVIEWDISCQAPRDDSEVEQLRHKVKTLQDQLRRRQQDGEGEGGEETDETKREQQDKGERVRGIHVCLHSYCGT